MACIARPYSAAHHSTGSPIPPIPWIGKQSLEEAYQTHGYESLGKMSEPSRLILHLVKINVMPVIAVRNSPVRVKVQIYERVSNKSEHKHHDDKNNECDYSICCSTLEYPLRIQALKTEFMEACRTLPLGVGPSTFYPRLQKTKLMYIAHASSA